MNGVPLGEARPSGLMGLLKRPADSGCLAALGAEPPISGLTEALFVSNRAKGTAAGPVPEHSSATPSCGIELSSDCAPPACRRMSILQSRRDGRP